MLRGAKSNEIDIEGVEIDPLSGKIVIVAKGTTDESETALDLVGCKCAHAFILRA